jgi:hypothetical protein
MFKALCDYANRREHENAGYWIVCNLNDGSKLRGAVIDYDRVNGQWIMLQHVATDSSANTVVSVNAAHCVTAEIEW